MKILHSGPIKAWHQHHTTKKVTTQELRYEIQDLQPDDGVTYIVFQLFGGPTGYESFVLLRGEDRWDPTRMLDCGYWPACAGTKGRWHALRINAKDMRVALEEYLPELEPPHPLSGQEVWAIGIASGQGAFGMTHGPMPHVASMLEVTGQKNACIIHFFGDGTEEITHWWRDSEWVAVKD